MSNIDGFYYRLDIVYMCIANIGERLLVYTEVWLHTPMIQNAFSMFQHVRARYIISLPNFHIPFPSWIFVVCVCVYVTVGFVV